MALPIQDSVSTKASPAGGTSATWSHTCSGPNRALYVAVGYQNESSQTVSGVTFNGDALTQVIAQSGGNSDRVDLWRLTAPDVGTYTVIVTFSAGVSRSTCVAASYKWVHQTTPDGSTTSSSGGTGDVMLTVTTADATILAVMAAYQRTYFEQSFGGTMGITAGTEVARAWGPGISDNGLTVVGRRTGANPSVAVTWDNTSNLAWTACACAVVGAAGSPSDVIPPTVSITSTTPAVRSTSRNVTFTFTGTDDVSSVGNLQYAVQLVGYEATASAFGPATFESYIDLPNGTYTFTVWSKDEADNISVAPDTVVIKINVLAPGGVDTYRGWTDLPMDNPTGRYFCAPMGTRWMLISPDGHAMWTFSLFGVDVTDGGAEFIAALKTQYGYASGDPTPWAEFVEHAGHRMEYWGFNTHSGGGYTTAYAYPFDAGTGFVNPVQMPVRAQVQATHDAEVGAAYKMKEIEDPIKVLMTPSYIENMYHVWGFPDVFDPIYDVAVVDLIGPPSPDYASYPAWVICFEGDDGDYLYGIRGGEEFHAHAGWQAAVTAPTQSVHSADAPAHGTVELNGMTYSDTTVYTKLVWRNFLVDRYGTPTSIVGTISSSGITVTASSGSHGIVTGDYLKVTSGPESDHVTNQVRKVTNVSGTTITIEFKYYTNLAAGTTAQKIAAAGALSALNTAWSGSPAISVASLDNGTGSWPTGTGLLTMGPASYNETDPYYLTSVNAEVRACFQGFVTEQMRRYFKPKTERLRALYPDTLIGAQVNVSVNCPDGVAIAAGEYCDILQVAGPAEVKLQNIYNLSGLPMYVYHGALSQDDSPPTQPPGTWPNFATQELRAQFYADTIADMLTWTGADGKHFILGTAWWAYCDKVTGGEGLNFGWVAYNSHNAYGKNSLGTMEDVTATSTDPFGWPVGGQKDNLGTPTSYGDFITTARQANLDARQTIIAEILSGGAGTRPGGAFQNTIFRVRF